MIIKKAQAGVVLEPKEKGGMVTIMQRKKRPSQIGQHCTHCIEVDVGHGNEFTIRNLELNLTFDE